MRNGLYLNRDLETQRPLSVTELLAECTVRLSLPGGAGGTGFFIAPGWVLTCAHVVAKTPAAEVCIQYGDGTIVGRVRAQHPLEVHPESAVFPAPDIALVQLSDFRNHACVWLEDTVPIPEAHLYTKGYTETWEKGHPSGEPATFTYEGLQDTPGGQLLKFRAGEAVPGMSGGPLLNLDTGRVCGVVKTTRDPRNPRGGFGVPTRILRALYPEIWEAHDQFHRANDRWRSIAERWADVADLLFEPALPGSSEVSPSFLLRPEFEVVPFQGRDESLRELISWCSEPQILSVRLITGAGGQGKTRLGRQLSQLLSAAGWRAGMLRAALTDAAVEKAQQTSFPCLLIVDYAETRVAQVTQLLRGLIQNQRLGLTRLLLLARSAGDWWTSLRTSEPHFEYALGGSREIKLPKPASNPAMARQLYEEALEAFAKKLNVKVSTADMAPTELQDESILQLHVAALATVLEVGESNIGIRQSDPTQTVLNHERRYWQRAASAAGLGMYEAVDLDRLMVAATMCGADDEGEAIALLQRIPNLPRQDNPGNLARLIRRLYPSHSRYWSPLQPDVLGEDFVAEVMLGSSAVSDVSRSKLTAQLFLGASAGQIYRALSLLVRAASRHAHIHRIVATLLRQDTERLAPFAIEIATQMPDSGVLVSSLRQGLKELSEKRVVSELIEMLPDNTIALAEVAVDITQYALEYHRDHGNVADISKLPTLFKRLSNRLADVGRREDALDAIEEAVRHYRILVDTAPDSYLLDLASSLNNLSNRLSELRKSRAALEAIQESVDIHRKLISMAGGKSPEMIVSLNNFSNRFGEVGRPHEALNIIEEVVLEYRRTADDTIHRSLSSLSMALNNLSCTLAEINRPDEALSNIREAVVIRRHLFTVAPDAYLPNLARALNNFSNRLAESGKYEDALRTIEEAIALWRPLVIISHDTYLPELAASLNNRSNRLMDVGKEQSAHEAIDEAIRYYREFVTSLSDPDFPDLMIALSNLAARQGQVGDSAKRPTGIDISTREYRDLH